MYTLHAPFPTQQPISANPAPPLFLERTSMGRWVNYSELEVFFRIQGWRCCLPHLAVKRDAVWRIWVSLKRAAVGWFCLILKWRSWFFKWVAVPHVSSILDMSLAYVMVELLIKIPSQFVSFLRVCPATRIWLLCLCQHIPILHLSIGAS